MRSTNSQLAASLGDRLVSAPPPREAGSRGVSFSTQGWSWAARWSQWPLPTILSASWQPHQSALVQGLQEGARETQASAGRAAPAKPLRSSLPSAIQLILCLPGAWDPGPLGRQLLSSILFQTPPRWPQNKGVCISHWPPVLVPGNPYILQDQQEPRTPIPGYAQLCHVVPTSGPLAYSTQQPCKEPSVPVAAMAMMCLSGLA